LTDTQPPLRCLGLAGVAGRLGMTAAALEKSMQRHPGWPAPTATIEPGRKPGKPDQGWAEDTIPDWKVWREAQPGHGGRPANRHGAPASR
jgi:hypothetical protein